MTTWQAILCGVGWHAWRRVVGRKAFCPRCGHLFYRTVHGDWVMLK